MFHLVRTVKNFTEKDRPQIPITEDEGAAMHLTGLELEPIFCRHKNESLSP